MTADDTTRPVPAAAPTLTPDLGPGHGPDLGPAADEPPAPEPGAHAVVPYEPARMPARGPRMRTLVLGLVLLAVSVTSGIRLLTDVHLDNGIVLLVLLLVAGALLLGGGVLGAAREARSPRD